MLWVKVILLFLLVPGIADIAFPWLILSKTNALTMPVFGWMQVLGLLLICAGLAVVVWVCQAFVRFGKGTPAPFDPPRQFVRQGLYRWVRNPMYLGAAILVPLGEALFFCSWWMVLYLAVLFLILHLYIVLIEEKELERRFGRPYLKYKRSVPRWIPRRPQDNL
jgi:protein-S-isoprenylcysteine O-methyltransferase Ste14